MHAPEHTHTTPPITHWLLAVPSLHRCPCHARPITPLGLALSSLAGYSAATLQHAQHKEALRSQLANLRKRAAVRATQRPKHAQTADSAATDTATTAAAASTVSSRPATAAYEQRSGQQEEASSDSASHYSLAGAAEHAGGGAWQAQGRGAAAAAAHSSSSSSSGSAGPHAPGGHAPSEEGGAEEEGEAVEGEGDGEEAPWSAWPQSAKDAARQRRFVDSEEKRRQLSAQLVGLKRKMALKASGAAAQ